MTYKAYSPPLAIAATSLGLLIATILSTSTNKWTGLYILLPICTAFSAISAGWEWKLARRTKNEKDVSAMSMSMNPCLKWLVIIPSISLFILLFVRLLFTEHFSSDAAALDFGHKHGDPDNINISFRGGSSWGHWIQGFIATLCAYAATAVQDRPKISIKLECASYVGTVYIVYNFVKRMLRTPDTFATSSFMNNGCEWAIGALVGVATGMLIMVCAKQQKANRALEKNDDGDDEERQGNQFELSLCSGTPASRCASIALLLCRTIGALFLLSVVAAAVLMGLTWNNCADGGTECGNYDAAGVPIGITVGLTLIPVVVAVCGLAMGKPR